MKNDIDVIVVGAGPVGLLAAIELTLGGARVRVLERLTAPATAMKAMSIGPLAAEALQRRGMAGSIEAAEAASMARMRTFASQAGADPRSGDRAKYSGHFAGLLVRRDPGLPPERRARPLEQPELEAMLAARAFDLGVDLRRGAAIISLAQDADGVEVGIGAGDGPARMRCAWLLGCDGGRSTVRKLAGFAFPGAPPTLTFYQAIVAIDHPDRLGPLGWRRTPHGVFGYGPIPGRLFMLDFNGPPPAQPDGAAPIERAELEAILRRISGADVRIDALTSASRWADNVRLADDYRRGRVLLAGDAAHIHPPFGAQGLSLGLVDAANLGWKLAAVLRGEMPDSLLDSYTAERRPVAARVLDNTLAQVALLRPDPQSGALRALVERFMQVDEVNAMIARMTSGLDLRYGMDANEDGSRATPLGTLTGDMAVNDTTLYALMQDGAAVLLDASPDGGLSALATGASPRIRCVRVAAGRSLLVRPDACIAWVGAAAEPDDADAVSPLDEPALEEALARWFRPRPRSCR